MPPKKKKGRQDDDSDDESSGVLAATMAALNLKEKSVGKDIAKGSKEKDNEKAQDSKKGNKKGKAGRGEESDDEVPAKASIPLDDDDDRRKPKGKQAKGKAEPQTAAKEPVKDKKGGKKGGRAADSDEETFPTQDDSDDEDDGPKSKGKQVKGKAEPQTATKEPPKGKKGGKKGGRVDDSDEETFPTQDDSDDDRKGKAGKHAKGKVEVATQSKGKKPKKKGRRGDDSDDDEDDVQDRPELDDEKDRGKSNGKQMKKESEPALKASSKSKKGGKKGRQQIDSDSDEDPLAKMKALIKEDSEEEEDDDEDEAVLEVAKSLSKQGQGNQTFDKKASSKPKSLESKKGKKVEDSENDSEGEEQDDVVPIVEKTKEKNDPIVTKKSKSKSSKKTEDDDEEMKTIPNSDAPSDKSLNEKNVRHKEEEISATVKESSHTDAPISKDVKNDSSVTKDNKAEELKPITAAASATISNAVAEVPSEPSKPKTALQIKLEKAKKAKEEKEAAELVAKQLAAEQEKERKRLEEVERKKMEQQRLQEQQEKSKIAADALNNPDIATTSTTISTAKSVTKADPYAGLSEAEKLARLQSTMHGDDVHSEYARPQFDVDDDDEDNTTKSSSSTKKKDKISNKAKRRLAKEQESRDREEEYRIAMIKKSIEGAQFAVSQSAVNADDPMWQNSLDINVPSLTISAHNKELFYNATLSITHGRRYGLVGPNGAGKSTLLKMIAYGELKVPPRVDYLYVEQEVLADDTPAVDAVLKADKERWNLLIEEKEILKELEMGPNDALDSRLGEIHEELATINAEAAESKARRILFGLGFDAEMQIRPTKYFSGGWRMRISLARALFMEPTLLMLDEPTNHLDLNAVIWLDDYLQRWKKTLLVVSHDQDFLNSVCEEILHLEDKKLVVYKGNYDNFKLQEAVRRQEQQKAWERQEKKLRELKSKGLTKQNAEKEQLKLKSREPGARAQKKAEAASAAKGGIESGESQVELIKRPREYTVTFTFPEINLLNPPILQVRDVSFRYQVHLPWLFKDLSFGLDMNSRVCIVGPNGSGKSTLLKIITGEVNPPDGMVVRNPRLRVGVYNQHFVDRLPMEEDPVAYLRRLFNEETYQTARNLLGRFGLEGHAHTIPIRDLSGGQKARVVFAELSLMAPHILFLDEPTNNLDIESIDALCDALRVYNGGVVLVSHDARLIETTNCQLWVVEDQGVTPWERGFAHYRQHLLDKLEQQLAVIMPGSGERPGEKAK